MSTLKELAKEFREKIDANLNATRKMIRIDELTNEELEDMVNLYDKYKVDFLYKKGDLFNYDKGVYKVISEHTSQEGWKPSELPALYLSMAPKSVIPEWVQPLGAHDAYKIGDQVIFNDIIYTSTVDANTWSPDAHGWKKE